MCRIVPQLTYAIYILLVHIKRVPNICIYEDHANACIDDNDIHARARLLSLLQWQLNRSSWNVVGFTFVRCKTIENYREKEKEKYIQPPF
jgi:hypothetical protein